MNYIFYCLLIILPIWQDSPLVSILGSYGYSIVPLLSLITIIPYLFLTARDQLVSKGSFTDVWCKLTFYLVVLNFVADLIWLLSGNSYVLRGEDIVAKSIRGILTALSIGCYLIIVSHLSKSFDEERVVRPFFWTFVILSIVAVVEFTQLPNALPFAHYSGIFPYNRPRLLTLALLDQG